MLNIADCRGIDEREWQGLRIVETLDFAVLENLGVRGMVAEIAISVGDTN